MKLLYHLSVIKIKYIFLAWGIVRFLTVTDDSGMIGCLQGINLNFCISIFSQELSNPVSIAWYMAGQYGKGPALWGALSIKIKTVCVAWEAADRS